jgi:hypothetical protein
MTTHSAKVEPGDLLIERSDDSISFSYVRDGEEFNEAHSTTGRVKAVDLICQTVVNSRPTRVFVVIGGNLHKLSSSTVRMIADGKLTTADLLAE